MDQSPSHYNRAIPLTTYLLLPHASEASVLLVRDGAAWTLPHLTADAADFRRVQPLIDFVSEQYGMASVALRCAAYRAGADNGQPYRVYALDNLSPASPAPEGCQWVDESKLERLQLTLSEHRDIIRSGLRERDPTNVPELRSPWAQSGWLAQASEWIHTQLERLALPPLSPVTPERMWALSCIIRIETPNDDVYFKASPPFMTQEAAVMQALSQQYPHLIPPPLAVEIDRGWVLMPDIGDDSLMRIPDIRRWETALQTIAQMQVEQADHLDDWLGRGCPDRRLNRMVERIDPLIMVCTQLLSGHPQRFSAIEIDGLQSLSMRMKLLCANLAGYSVPHTLVHGDLAGNIMVQGDRSIVFDWSDVCIAHPFFEMAPIIQSIFAANPLPHEPHARTRLRDAYLEPWSAYETRGRLVNAFELSTSLGALHQAMSYLWVLMNTAEDARWEVESGLVLWLRRLLQLLPPASPS